MYLMKGTPWLQVRLTVKNGGRGHSFGARMNGEAISKSGTGDDSGAVKCKKLGMDRLCLRS